MNDKFAEVLKTHVKEVDQEKESEKARALEIVESMKIAKKKRKKV